MNWARHPPSDLGCVGRAFLETDPAFLDIGAVDRRDLLRVVLPREADQDSHSSNSPSRLVSRGRSATGATDGHSRQRAWIVGPLRIERTWPSAGASRCCRASA